MSEQNFPSASLARRLAALFYDGLLLISLYIVFGFILVGIIAGLHDGDAPGAFPAAVNLSLMFCICFFYYSSSWRRGGQTLGMKAWRIKLVSELPGKPIQLSQCMLRTGIGFFSLTIAGMGFWWAILDKRRRSWHDIASMTRVVEVIKQK